MVHEDILIEYNVIESLVKGDIRRKSNSLVSVNNILNLTQRLGLDLTKDSTSMVEANQTTEPKSVQLNDEQRCTSIVVRKLQSHRLINPLRLRHVIVAER